MIMQQKENYSPEKKNILREVRESEEREQNDKNKKFRPIFDKDK